MKNAPAVILLSLVICVTPNCRQRPGGRLNDADARDISDLVLKMWNEGDLSIADELYTSDYVRHHPVPEAEASLDELKATVISNRSLFPDYRLAFGEMIVEGDRLIVFATMTGTNTAPLEDNAATGNRVRMNGIYIFLIEEKKIAEEWTYFNLLHYYQQLGYSLAPPESSKRNEQ